MVEDVEKGPGGSPVLSAIFLGSSVALAIAYVLLGPYVQLELFWLYDHIYGNEWEAPLPLIMIINFGQLFTHLWWIFVPLAGIAFVLVLIRGARWWVKLPLGIVTLLLAAPFLWSLTATDVIAQKVDTRLEGAPESSARDAMQHLPLDGELYKDTESFFDQRYHMKLGETLIGSDDKDGFVADRTIRLTLADDARVGDVNDLLERFDAVIMYTDPPRGLMLIHIRRKTRTEAVVAARETPGITAASWVREGEGLEPPDVPAGPENEPPGRVPKTFEEIMREFTKGS